MLQKDSTAKPTFLRFIKRGAAILFVLEAASFGISYGVWHRMNTNRDFRQYIGDNYPPVLDYYYRFGELISGGQTSSIRKIDAAYWEHQPSAKSE